MRLLVPETLCHVQRCPRLSPERVVGIDGFRTVAGRPRDAENSSRPARPPHAHRLQATLMCKAKLRAYQNTVTGEIARVDGHVAKLMGDGVLAYFGWPRAHEDEAERAVGASLAIVEAVA